ncbi:MAG: hypothetical protein QOE77_2153 [Blastocatellia bacterium]|jgi:hypothetical protein|nr:hypothetical protein [Blastocatellia bacterium]
MRKLSLSKGWLAGRWHEVKIHAGVTIAVASSLFWGAPRTTLVFGGIICLFAYAYLGVREARRAPLKLSPLSFYFLWYTIGMGISPIYVGLVTDAKDSVRFASESSMVSLEDLASGYVMFLLGSFALHLGMQIFRPKVDPTSESQPISGLLAWLGLIWTVGLIFQLSPSSFSFLGGMVKILAVAVVGSVCAFAVTPRQRLGLSNVAFPVLLMVGTAGLFFGNLASGSKAYIMFSFLPITWLFILKRRLRAWAPALAICLGAFYLAVVAPVVYTSRAKPMEEGSDPRAHMVESFDTWLKDRPSELDQSFFADQLDQFVNRQFDPVPVGFIVGEVKNSGLLYGETMKYASYAFVPRILWPDKPSVTRGGWFSAYLGLYENEAEATTSMGMSAVGELYWNFGTWGVLIGMLLIGCLQGLLWRMAGADPRGKPLHMLLYVSLMLAMPDMPEAVTVFVALILSFFTFKAAFLVFDLMNRRKGRMPRVLRPYPLGQ